MGTMTCQVLCLWGAHIGTPSDHQVRPGTLHPGSRSLAPSHSSLSQYTLASFFPGPGSWGPDRQAGLVPDSDSPTAAPFHPPPLQ